MPLVNAQTGGRIPAPVTVTFPKYTGTLGQPARGFEPGAAGANPAPGKQISLLMKDSWTDPATASISAYISTGLTGAGEMPNANTITVSRTGALSAEWDGTLGATGKPDFPRNVVVTVTHGSSIVACNGVITGIDVYGRTITETWSVTATGTTKTYTGVTAFYRVDQITVISASDAEANTLKLGTGAVLGLSMPNPIASAVKETSAGSVVTNGTFVAASTSANADKRGTYAPNSAPNGSTDYAVWYVCDDPTGL